jgi:hypothetical protein
MNNDELRQIGAAIRCWFLIRAAALVVLGWSCVPSCLAADANQAEIVRWFFPERLRTGSDLKGDLELGLLQSQYAATDFDGSRATKGCPAFLVVAYGNAWSGAVRVIHRAGNDWALMAEVPVRSGSVRGIELRDLDGDGVPEVLARFATTGGRFERTWIFRWTGSSLLSLLDAPNDPEGKTFPGDLDVDDYLDLDGDGKSEIIARTYIHDSRDLEPGEDEPPRDVVQFSAYRISGGYYRLWKELVAYKFFGMHGHRDAGPYSESFPAANTKAHYVLRLVRTGFSKSWSIKSATIRLNGAVVADDSVFRQKLPVILVPVGLQADNVLTVSDLVLEGDESTVGQAVRDIPCLVISVETQ